ncbi:MAG: VCBS repeat-containing protein, partial [Candidatus Hydrogenedentes bacterium]|nr:VCBS repeat-containing protein [Candidatus Hydrogenedentota bacterium]
MGRATVDRVTSAMHLGRIAVALFLVAFACRVHGLVSTPGSAGVTPTGAATYSIPLFVVKGTAGMQPSLALNYSSQGGDGHLGIGWSLSGLSAISVCPLTPATDGVNGPIRFDTGNYAYCLDGKRLIDLYPNPMSCPAGSTEYRTEIETFVRVCRYPATNHFRVWTKSGLIMEYGTTADSKIEAAGTSHVMTWALKKVQDTKGNYMTVLYGEDATNGEFWPERIEYTGNMSAPPELLPYASVEFSYTSLAEANQIRGYLAGSPLRISRTLSVIRMKEGTNIARQYELEYQNTGAASRPRLVKVWEKGWINGTQWLTKQSTVFQYNGDAVAVSNFQSAGYSQTQNPHSFGAGGYADMAPYLGDFNGDGKLDIFWHREDSYREGMSDPTPTARIWLGVGPSNTQMIELSGIADCTPIVGDFNGDGRSDILWYPKKTLFNVDDEPTGPKNCGSGTPVVVWLSNGNGTFTNVTAPGTTSFYAAFGNRATWRPFLGDYNGDGKTDVLWANIGEAGSTDDPVYFWHGGGNGTFTLSSAFSIPNDSAPELGDFNGDGVTDILWDRKLADGRSAGYRTLWMSNGTGGWTAIQNVANSDGSYSPWVPIIVDANGDGKADILWDLRYADGRSNGQRILWIGKGDGSFEIKQNVFGLDGYFNGCTLLTGDFNGDGKTDVFWDYRDATNRSTGGIKQIWISANGSAWSTYYQDTLGVAANAYIGSTQIIADFNGDGKSDVLFNVVDVYGRTQAPSNLGLVSSVIPKQDVLIKVTNGNKLETSFTYKPLSDSGGRYTKGTSATYPQVDLIGPLYVVTEKTVDTGHSGAGGTHTSWFYYWGARVDVRGRGFLGFSQVKQEDRNNFTFTISTHRQDYPHIGSPSLVESYSSTFQLVGSVSGTLQAQSLGGTRYLPYLVDSTEIKNDLNGAFIGRTLTQNSAPDAHGNVAQISVYSHTSSGVNDGHATITNNVYDTSTAATANWLLGRLSCAAVTKFIPSGANQTRVSAFTYESATGLLLTETIEPGTACGSASPTTTDPQFRLRTVYGYDTWGNVQTRTVESAVSSGQPGYFAPRTTTTVFDSTYRRTPATITNPIGQIEQRIFNGVKDGYTSITDINNLTATIEYDGLGRKTKERIQTSAGSPGTFVERTFIFAEYPATSPSLSFWVQTEERVEGLGTLVQPIRFVAYDRLGRPWRPYVGQLDGNFMMKEARDFDAWGRNTHRYRPVMTGGTCCPNELTSHDVLGRPTMVYAPHPTALTYQTPTSIVYNGRITTITDPKGQVTEQEVNSQGQVIRITQAKGTARETTLDYVYDSFGNRTTVTRVTGSFTHTTTMQYDLRGRKTDLIDPDAGARSYGYDALGQLVW